MANLIYNPGFEIGTVYNWTTYSNGSGQTFYYPQPGKSDFSVSIASTSTGKKAYFYQTVNVSPSTTYTFSYYVKHNITIGNAGAKIQVDWISSSGGYLSTSELGYMAGNIDWKPYTFYPVSHPSAASAQVSLVLENCTGQVWFDNLSMKVGTGTNIIRNPGFMSGSPNGWTKWSTGTGQTFVYPASKYSGVTSASIKSTSNGGKAVYYQTVNVSPSTTYKLSGYGKVEIPPSSIVGWGGAKIQIDWLSSSGGYLSSFNTDYGYGSYGWDYRSYDIPSHPSATSAQMSLVLERCTGQVWFDNIIFEQIAIPTPTPTPPPTTTTTQPPAVLGGIFLNSSEVATQKTKLSQEPWKSAYNNLIAKANTAKNLATQSVVYQGPAHPSNQHYYWSIYGQQQDYQACLLMAQSVRDLGIAYAFTGDSNYAYHALRLIKGWCLDSATFMYPTWTYPPGTCQMCIEIPLVLTSMCYGADLIWNYSGWNDNIVYPIDGITMTVKAALKKWLNALLANRGTNWAYEPWTTCAGYNGIPNYANWGLSFWAAVSILTGDTATRNWAFGRFKELIDHQMGTNGSYIFERCRYEHNGVEGAGMFYSHFCHMANTAIAEMSRHQGNPVGDLYAYTINSKGFEKASDFHANYLPYPTSWPYVLGSWSTDGNRMRCVGGATYEIINHWKYKAAYANCLNVSSSTYTTGGWWRPIYDDQRIFGPTTLTHGV